MPAVTEESGFSLIEVLITVTIVGVAFVTLMGGIRMYIVAADYHHKEVTNQDVLARSAEFIKSQPYISCTSAPGYLITAPNTPSGWSQMVTGSYYWNASTSSWAPWATPSPSTPGTLCTSTTDAGLERVDIEVWSTDNRATDTLSVIKSNATS